MIVNWVKTCENRHDQFCIPVATKALESVRLINVDTRKVVQYPGPGCEYIAVSYVWGNVPQKDYKLGDVVDKLPRTLEDALSLTARLGKRFAWVDSICIDQSDKKDKLNQINRMWGIYQGAWITIIALSSASADAGLSRLSRKENFPQLMCRIRGKTVIGLMPTLSQQIWTSPWGRRAWTLQEGLLSARCLYISDHQIYYDCSSMQCCESLDDSNSWAHGLTPASNPTQEGFVTWMLRQAGAGALRIPIDWPSRRLEHWGEKLNLYSYRTMTYKEDAIRAFTGVLQRLETIYPKGFFWGLPVEDLDWALSWAPQVPPERRDGFPTWSWAGWKGPIFFGQPIHVQNTRRIPTSLTICAAESGELKQLFPCGDDRNSAAPDIRFIILHDPIHAAAQLDFPDVDFQLDKCASAETDGYLFITGVCLHFTPDFSNPRTATYAAGQHEQFLFTVREVRCLIRIFSTDDYIPGQWTGTNWIMDTEKRAEDTFLLLARDYALGLILHKLLLITTRDSDNVVERVTTLELCVPLDELHILEDFKPQKKRIVLG